MLPVSLVYTPPTKYRCWHTNCICIISADAQELRPYQESRKLVAMPSPLEWLSYIFASGNLLAGPFFELRDYRDYIQRQRAWAGGFPSGVLPGIVRLLKAMLCMAVHLRLTQGFNASTLESAWYYSQPLWSRCVPHTLSRLLLSALEMEWLPVACCFARLLKHEPWLCSWMLGI